MRRLPPLFAVLAMVLGACAQSEGDPPPRAAEIESAEQEPPMTPAPVVTPVPAAGDTPIVAERVDTADAPPPLIPPGRDSARQGPIIELPAAPVGPPGSQTQQ